VHLASSDAIDLIEQAQKQGLKLSAETTYHYLCLCAEGVLQKNTLFKCCPPIREDSNRDKLWSGLRRGVITQVISDHSPCTTNLKQLQLGDFMKAWGGIASLQLGLPLMWTEASKRGHSLTDLVQWMCINTSKLVQLDKQKGSIELGKDADFVVWDPETTFIVTPDKLEMKNKRTPYEGLSLKGRVQATFLRGQKVYENGMFLADKPTGSWVKRI